MCFADPTGFQRMEDSYQSVGLSFYTPEAYAYARRAQKLWLPVMVAAALLVLAAVACLGRKRGLF